ncbi:Ig-like domain-containing protein [Shewanella oncorhynchi]|uniref:Ig-like domain-containing protein n=1 Tax=Shewanella oncorhynchi TaxID=2726434 RepID=UPI003D7A1987
MRHALLSGLSSLLLPFGLYGAGAIAAPSYQRSYLSSSISASTDLLLRSDTSLPQDLIDLSGDQLDIQSAHPVRELVIVDGAVAEADKSVLRRALKPSVQLVELDSSIAGLPQLINVLDGHKNLAAIHVVSHAQAGVILLGNSRITPETIQQEVQAFAALKGAVREGGDLLFYGCDLAANESGEALLDIISNNTGLDVAASNNLTGNAELQGDWDLEVTRGNIESTLVFSEKALRDFSEVLAPIVDGTYDFAGWSGQGTAQLSTTHFRLTAKGGDGVTQNLGNGLGNFAYMHGGATSTNHYFYLRADGTNTTAFELTGLTGGEYAGYSSEFTNLRIVGYLQSGGTVTSSVVNGVPGAQNFAFGAGQLGSFSGVKLKGFKLFFDCASACTLPNDGPENFEFRSFTVANAIDTPPLPTVSDARIGISGASGTSGAYKIGDIVTATWNNTAGGDNNSGVTGVTVDFSQFGGGAAVAATDSSGTWTATYVITSGAIDASSRNVSVTATNAQGGTTTADTTNAVVDNVAPVVTDNRLGLSGATGTGGAYKIGDTVTATWNNTAGGDNNSDTISSATVNFSQFGGGAAVAATNSSGAWTATYTIVAGAIDTTNRNISFSATDNAGNNTTTADTSNATLDNVAPFVSDVYIGISGGTGTAGTFIAGDTVTASWDNSAIGDDNSDTISAATVDFSQFGGGAVAATNNSGTWTAIYTLVAGAINTTNRNVSVTATDNAGNTRTQADSSNATVDNVVPAVTSVSVPANATYITGQSLDFTVNTSEAIIVGGTPRIALTLGASTVYASYLSGTGSSALTFRYTVQSGDFDTDGIAIAGSIEANGGTLKEGSGNTLNLVLNSIGSTTAVLVDAVPPTVSSVTVPTDNTYAVGDTLSFTVSSTENVTVNTGGGTPRIVLTIGGTTRYALYISGSGTSNLVFSYAVQAGDNDTDGIGLASSIDANGGALLDGAGNNLALTLNSVGSTTAILVDTATPTVQSFNPLDGAIGVAVGANFVLTMNEDIQLGSGNIVIYNTDDVAVATIDVGSPVGQLTITAGVLTINPAANLVENTSYYIQIANGAITDLAGNLYAGISNKTDWNFTVADVTPPVVTGIVVTGSPAANGTSLVFTVSFDEVASNLSTDDFVLTATGSASGSIASVSAASGTSVDVTVNTVSGTGSLRLDVKANSNIQDASGNGNGTNGYTAAYTGGASHTVDRDAPLAPSGLDLATASDSGISSTDNLTSDTTPTLTGNAEANSTVTLMSSIDGVLGTTTADGSGNWSFTTPLLTSNSAHNITATATDVAGNTGAVSTALVLTLDTQIPTITSSAPAVGAAAADASVIFNLAFSESVNSLTTDDFALASTGTASGTISSVSASSGTGVVVTVNGISGTGSLKVGHTTSDIVDDAGNALGTYSAGTAHSVDTDAPTISGVSFDQTSVTQANQNAISLTLASAEVGTSANYTITGSSGTPVAGSIAVASASQQIVNIDVSALGDGTLTVSLTLTDAAGNVSSPAVTDTISKDAVIPAVNVVNVNDGHYGVGSAIDITLTLTEDVTVSGTLSTLSLDIDGVARQAVFVSAASGVLTYRYTVQAGDNTGASGLIVDANGIALNGDTMRDAGSNDADLSYSQWNSVNVIVDTTAPVDPVVTTPAGAISTNQATTLISGTHAEDGVTISLYADVNNDGVADNATVLDDTIVVAGAWTLSAALSTDSDNNFVVVASDAASNVSAPQNVPTITQDATVPVAPSAPDLDAASDSGVSSTDNITKNTTLILTGTAEAGASVVLSSHLDGVLGTVNADGSGDWSVNATSVSPGTHSITAVATDIAGNSSVASSALSVTIDTSAPTSSAIAHQNIQPGESSSTLAFTIADDVTAATDILVTPASSDTTVVPLAGVVLVGSEADRGVTVTALGSGTSTITLTLVDIAGNTSTRSFDVVVNSVPTILGTPATNVAQGTLYNFMPIAADADGNSLVFDITNRPSWAGFNTATGALSGTPSNADVGMTTAIVISVSDGVLSASLPAFNLTVTNVNDAPTISSTAMTAATQDAAYSYSLTAIDSDVGDVLTLSAVTKPSWLSFNSVTGLLSGTPSNADVGGHAVLLRVTDTDGLTADQSFSITVTNSNDAPTITSTATMAAVQDAVYSYTFAATDVDVDDVLTFSAVTIPSWLSFNAATGLLSGTPGNADVGSHAVTLRVTDTDGLTAEQSFSITVTNVNDAPVATSASVTLEEDSSVMITLTGEDADSDPLTYEVVSQPESGTLEQHGTVWLYTPEKDFNGADQISFIAKDAELSSEPATITMNVTPVNDDPQAVDDNYTLASTADDKYTLPALENDVDVDGDTLTIDGAAADIGSVQITDDGLIFTAPAAYVGPVALRYTISDGQKGRASAKVNLLVEGGEADNLPVITVPSDVEVNATGLFTRVDLGFAKAVDRNGHPLPVSLVDKRLFFAPGSYLAYWQAVDRDGNKATKAQKVKVHPLISLSKDQVVGEGNEVVVSIHLNGVAPEYPISVPYTVAGSADSNDHDLVDAVVEITSGTLAHIHFRTIEDGEVEAEEEVLISLDPSLNLGSKKQTQVSITEANIAPSVTLEVTQAGERQLIVAQNGGEVHIHAQISDANMNDTLTSVWSSGALNLQSDDAGMFFLPTEVLPGIYPVSLTVTDSGLPALSTTEKVYIVVRPSLPPLTGTDTDGDLIPDNQEGFTDTDRDGIPDYLDAINDCNVMPEGELQPVYFLAEGQAGVCLRLGNIALMQEQSGIQLLPNLVPEDSIAANVGGIFDFIATGLPQQGQSYSLVIPQRSPVPANAVYRKYQAQNGWKDFVIDARNSVASSEGERGFCPPPGDSRWTSGLTEGHWCVQLTIEDGGPNDDDGVANRTIVDPSGVSVILNGNHLPVANPDTASLPWNQSLDVDVLANDTDSDGDALTVTQVTSEFGTVVILANQQLSYTPATDFIGTDVLVYSITDGKGGTASSELTVIVNGNTAPTTVNDSAAIDDRTSLLLDVLSNDSDPDGNVLTLVSATAQQGTVSVESNKLRYIPKTGFDGVDTVSYQISDGLGGEATGQALITVKAYQNVVIDNKSGGGSMSLWALGLILTMGLIRRKELHKLVLGAVLLVGSVNQANAADNWYVEGFVGQAQVDNSRRDLQPQAGTGFVTSVDDKDTALGVSIGYQWTPFVAIELGYADFGNGSARIEGASLTPEQYHEQVKAVTPVLADGVMLGLRFTLLQHEAWRFEVPIGLFRWQADISSTMGNSRLTTELDGTDWYAGVRFSYQFSDSWSVGLGYQYVDIEPNDFLSYQLNLRYQF